MAQARSAMDARPLGVPTEGDGAEAALAGGGSHVFSLPASHSARLAQAAAVTTGVLALLILGLRFVDLREGAGDLSPLPAPASADRPEVDLPSLTKPIRSEFPRLRDPETSPEGATVADAEPAGATAPPVVAHDPAEPARAASTGHPAEAPAFVGVWGPNESACTPRTNRAGYLPAVITAEGAFAGETSCAFRNPKAVAGGWSVSAACQSAKGRWTTQVRLAVSGRRLTWSSARGTQTYVRCGEAGPHPKG